MGIVLVLNQTSAESVGDGILGMAGGIVGYR